MTGRLHLADALDEARRLAIALPAERVPLGDAVGRGLAEGIASLVDLPGADASLMDGWAVRSADLPGALAVIGESRAGAPWHGSVGAGQAVAISTGALLPDGADCVARLEDASWEGSRVTVPVARRPGHDVRPAGEDMRSGDPVLPAGTMLAAHHVAAVAASGHGTVICRGVPDAAVVVCGSELVQAGGAAGPGMVFDANQPGLAAQLRHAGARVASVTTVGDDRQATRRALADASRASHLLVVAGGMSVGAHDHARAALEDLGMQPVFTRLAMRPGQPSMMGTIGECRVLALPGNPSAAAVGVHVLGRALLGAEVPQVRLPLATATERHPDLSLVLRCRDTGGQAAPLPLQASGSVMALARADLLAWVPPGEGALHAGSPVVTWRL